MLAFQKRERVMVDLQDVNDPRQFVVLAAQMMDNVNCQHTDCDVTHVLIMIAEEARTVIEGFPGEFSPEERTKFIDWFELGNPRELIGYFQQTGDWDQYINVF